MADSPRKTYPQLEVQTTVQATDLLASQRGDESLKGLPASVLTDFFEVELQPIADAAQASADDSAASAADSLAFANAAEGFANSAAQSASEAEIASLAALYYPAAQANVPRGIVSTSALVAGAGGTNGTFALAFSGGNFAVNPAGTFTVAGGSLTSVLITGPGLYIGASPTAPTAVLTASAGLAGASVVLDVGFLVGSGEFYWTDHLTDTNLAALYQSVSGVATATSPLVTLTKALVPALVPCTVGGTANAITMTPKTGFSVSGGGVDQEFTGMAQAGNSVAGLTVAIAGVNAGAATEVLLPSGGVVPALALKLNYPFKVRWNSLITKYVLTSPTFQTQQSFVNLVLLPASTANSIHGKLSHPEIKTPADFTNVNFSVTVELDAIAGSKALTVYAFDGVTVLVSSSIFHAGGENALEAGIWLANDTVTLQRQASGLVWIVQSPNPAIQTIPAFSQAIDPVWGLPVTDDRAVSLRQSGNNTYLVEVKPPDSYYVDTDSYCSDDFNKYTLFDMRNFQANVPGGVVALNSYFARFALTDIAICNLQFTVLEGNSTDTGQVPSTFEPPFFAGNDADPVSGTNFAPRGVGHGYMEETVCTLIGTLDAVDSDNLYDAGPTTEWTGQSLVSTTTGFITDTTGNKLAAVEYVLTLEQNAEYTCSIYASYDWSAAEVVPATTGAGAYSLILPMRNANRCVGFLNGSRVGGIHTINLRDGSLTNVGVIDTLIAWHTDAPEIQTVVTNLVGAGKSCLINGVAQTATEPSAIQNNTWGPKLIGTPLYALGASKLLLSGIYEFSYGIKIQRQPEILV